MVFSILFGHIVELCSNVWSNYVLLFSNMFGSLDWLPKFCLARNYFGRFRDLWFLLLLFISNFVRLNGIKARGNAHNIVGQQDATLLDPTCCERLHTILCVVATCWKLLDEVWNWSNFRANKCQHFCCFAIIEAWSNNVAFVCTAHPTMLRRCTRTKCHVSTQIHANKK